MTHFLNGVFIREISRWKEFLFNILSITYGSGSIGKIMENLEKGSAESINYAHEMIDIVIDDSIKQKLIYILDIVPDKVKLKNLYHFYQGEIPEYDKIMEDILNRDYNILGIWTKACTLRNLTKIEGDKMTESVVALLFSSEAILQEESAKLIYRTSSELYRSASQRISDSSRNRLDLIIYGETDSRELLLEKTQFLSNCFQGIPEDDLLSLSAAMKLITDGSPGIAAFPDDCIIWPLTSDNRAKRGYLRNSGSLKAYAEKFNGMNNTAFYLLPLSDVEVHNYQYPERSFEILEYIDSCEEQPAE